MSNPAFETELNDIHDNSLSITDFPSKDREIRNNDSEK
jgi:hypothetical protein